MLLMITVFVPVAVNAESFVPQTSDDRLTQALQSQGLSFNDSEKQNISQKCYNAQQKLTGIREKTENSTRRWINDFTVIQKELLAMKLRMARQGVDASEIDLLIGKIQQSIDNFLLSSNSYGTTVDDVLSINCTEKPELFKAGVLLMRAQHLSLLTSADELKNTLDKSNTLAFEQLKKRLTL